MAKLSFFRGAVTGKLGEFVGSKWKGINYLKLYSKPSNPKTEGQISVRLVFKALSDFATALFLRQLFEYFPPARKMTERNSVFKANKQMLSTKTFAPLFLQVCRPNLDVNLSCDCSYQPSGSSFTLSCNGKLAQSAPSTSLFAHAFIYDPATGFISDVAHYDLSIDFDPDENIFMSDHTYTLDKPSGYRMSSSNQTGDIPATALCFFFVTASTETKKFISPTAVTVPRRVGP